MKYDQVFYAKDADGTVSKWYVVAWYGPRFAVSPVKNAKLSNYTRYYHMYDLGKTIFATRKEANESQPVFYPNDNYVYHHG